MHQLVPVEPLHRPALARFLGEVDLTVSGLDSPTVRLWVELDEHGRVVASTGYELSADGEHALIRSVAVHPSHRREGAGTHLAEFAVAAASAAGARTAWLFSRRSGAFWRSLGFVSADRDTLAETLAETHQVRHFRHSGRLGTEVAWSKAL